MFRSSLRLLSLAGCAGLALIGLLGCGSESGRFDSRLRADSMVQPLPHHGGLPRNDRADYLRHFPSDAP